MANGWGVHIASLPGHGLSGNIGTTNDRGALLNGSGRVNSSASPTDYVSIWPNADQYPWDVTPGILSIESDSASDTLAGAGARSILASGLDANLEPLSEVVELNGVTPALSVGTFSRLHGMAVIESGANARNAGTINATISGSVVSTILPSISKQNQTTWTVPATWINGAILGQISLFVSERQTTAVEFSLKTRPHGSSTWTQAPAFSVHNHSPLIVGTEGPEVFESGMDLEIVATSSTRNNALVLAGAEFLQL